MRVELLPPFASRKMLTGMLLAAVISVSASESRSEMPGDAAQQDCPSSISGSPFIPVDSWAYAAMLRLYSLGFLDHVFLNMRPWTRASVGQMLEETENNLEDVGDGPVSVEAQQIFSALRDELEKSSYGTCLGSKIDVRMESAYTAMRAIGGTPLRDSFHLGSTIINDYGRPYQNGLNNYSGASGYGTAGRFTVYVRGEFQGAPSATGYSSGLSQALASIDKTVSPITGLAYANQTTIPLGPIGTTLQGRLLEAYLSTQVLNHVISFGKQDEWLGPAQGASFAYSNNAENIYAFHINRIEPLYVPVLSSITGSFRYELIVGPLRGHTRMLNPLYTGSSSTGPNVINPGNPWVHIEKISFHPTDNLEFGFERTALFGGEGHSPVTLHTFLKSFFSLSAPTGSVKNGRTDPGARFGAFDFSYRLPFVRNWLMLYLDSEVHDDVSPIDAPRRAAIRPGLYLSHVPGIAKLDVRAEAAMTDPSISNSHGGTFMYWEGIEKQGYTNQGQLFGDWIGREDKGGQAWLTYHLTGNESVQFSLRNQKAAKDFISASTANTSAGTNGSVQGGTTLNDIGLQVAKRIGNTFELRSDFTFEDWKAPIDLPGRQAVTSTTIQLTWMPRR